MTYSIQLLWHILDWSNLRHVIWFPVTVCVIFCMYLHGCCVQVRSCWTAKNRQVNWAESQWWSSSPAQRCSTLKSTIAPCYNWLVLLSLSKERMSVRDWSSFCSQLCITI